MAEAHILLLPRENFWDWVQAVKEYVLRFGPNLTPDPDNAGRYRAPGQTITVILPPGGYAGYGDIQAWFRQKYPRAKLDVISADTPADLRPQLTTRIVTNDRYGERQTLPGTAAVFRLHWPTDIAVITQSFGANPEIYGKFNLPGHEGVDFRAPLKSPVYAAADGVVVQVHPNDSDGSAYGRYIRIDHQDGYQTTYGHLDTIMVGKGQHVRAKEQIGKADSTGNSTGSHLHLTLKKAGATKSGLTYYPSDIIDPTPFLIWPDQEGLAQQTIFGWPPERCLIGVNSRPDGVFAEADYQTAVEARVEAIKIPANTPSSVVMRLFQINPAIFIVARLQMDFSQKGVSPDRFVQTVKDDFLRLVDVGVRYFEVSHEPNLQANGYNRTWSSGADFGNWFIKVWAGLKAFAPDAHLGFPGLSPGNQVPGQRFDDRIFLRQAEAALRTADWIGVNCFWVSKLEMTQADKGRRHEWMRQMHPDKILMITEFANLNALTDINLKGEEYLRYYADLRMRPGYAAAFCNILSSPGQYANLAWRKEDGQVTKVPNAIGGRNF